MLRKPYAIPILSQYLLLAVVAVVTLTSPLAPDTWQWWLTAGLLAALGILYYRWPRCRYRLYLALELVLVLALVVLNPNAVFLGFAFAAHAAILFPNRSGALWIAALSILASIPLIYHEGWLSGIMLALLVAAGLAAFGYANYARELAEAARRDSQALLAQLQETHQQLQDYAEQVQSLTLAEERNRLARELHDSAKQQAFAASARLAAARLVLAENPEAAKGHLAEAERLIHGVSQELTSLIHELRPPDLEGRGLVAAMNDHVERWSQHNDVNADLRVQGERGLPLEVEQALFRTVQEALSNVARHSEARSVTIGLDCDPDRATLTIEDDGQGFDVGASHEGIGLRSMSERAERLRGTLRTTSVPGKGSRITASYPLPTQGAPAGRAVAPARGENAHEPAKVGH